MKNTGLYKFWKTLRNSKDQKRISCGDIRLYDENQYSYCPLTYVYKKVNGRFISSYNWEKAAQELGIDSEYAKRIVDAADEDNGNPEPKLRRKLLNALGLKEQK